MRKSHSSGLKPALKTVSQRGFTLVELMVAMVISLVIAAAAVSVLIVSRRGFTTVDAASQLRDNARFARDLIQRIGVQTGYQDVRYAATIRSPNNIYESSNPYPNIFGFNNALAHATEPLTNSTARKPGTVGYGSDVLVLSYQTGETFPGSGKPDGTMIDCAGYASATATKAIAHDRDDRRVSIFHVAVDVSGEPALMCTTVSAKGGKYYPQPLISGVENFQVLYGVDHVTANTAPTGTTDGIAAQFLRADQMGVTSGSADQNLIDTHANWRRVRSLRIGIVVRGPVGSAQDTANQWIYPFGMAASSLGGKPGSALSSANDVGTAVNQAADRRMRQAVTFTVHLRNYQGL